MADTAIPRKRRRLRRFLAIVVIGPLLTIAALPTLLSTSPVRYGLLALANGYLAPARIDAGGLRLSWFGTLRISGLVLTDPGGKRLVAIPQANLNRSLLELLFDRSDLGALTLEGPAIDITRRTDGSIDLVEAFARFCKASRSDSPRTQPSPASSKSFLDGLDFTLKVVKGSLRVQAPELAEPLNVDRFDLTVETTAAPGPLNLRLRMEQGSEPSSKSEQDAGTGAEAAVSSLGIDGTYDIKAKAGTPADLSLNILARCWPFSLRVAGVSARGQLDGQAEADLKGGLWDLKGDLRLLKLDASGRALAGDRLQLDQVAAIWDVVQGTGPPAGSELWAVRRFGVTSPVATLSANGPILGRPGTTARVKGRVDLAALARQLPHALRLRDGLTLDRGEAGMQVDLAYEADAQAMEIEATLSDLLAHDQAKTIALRSPASLAARVTRRTSNLRLERLAITSDFIQTAGSGDLDQGIGVKGSIDLGALQAQVRDLIDFGGVEMAGRGEYSIAYKRTGTRFDGSLTSEFRGLDLRGLTAEPIRREVVQLAAAASGECNLAGVPQSLGAARVGLTAGQIGAFATASNEQGATALTLVFNGPLTLSERTDEAVRGELKFKGAWNTPELQIGALRLNVRPAGASADATPLALAVRGRFDRSKGELVLGPIPGTPPMAISLAREGLHVVGLGRAGDELKVEANLAGDVAALDSLIASFTGSAAHDLAGGWIGRVSVQPQSGGRLALAVRMDSIDVSTAPAAPGQSRSPEGPLALSIRGSYQAEARQLALEELGVVTRYASLTSKGQIADPAGRRLADLQGTLYPTWETLNQALASALEPAARLQGGAPRAFRVKGPLSGASVAEVFRGLDAELGVELAGAEALGLKLGPARLVVRCAGGQATIDPIETSLSGGRALLRPELVLDDPKGLSLRLQSGSALQEVEINDEVSEKLLTYIAPVLEEATQVHGRISARFDRAEFPIGGNADRTMTVTGAILFQDVVFGAGPLGSELLTLAGKGKDTALRIQQSIQLAIVNRRIHQSGLEIPINRETKITIKGSVGFDQTLALRADVPINPSLLGRDKMVQELARGSTIPVPIGGTLTHPKVDRQALSAAMHEVGKSILKRGAKEDAADLLKRFVR